MSNCKICGRPLGVPGDVASRDCGGDCLKCMAEIGDPDCQRAMHEAGLPFDGDSEYTEYDPPA